MLFCHILKVEIAVNAEMFSYDATSVGKIVIDYIIDLFREKPLTVILLFLQIYEVVNGMQSLRLFLIFINLC